MKLELEELMSDKFSIFKKLVQKVRLNDFDDSDELVNTQKASATKVDGSGKKRVVITDDSEVVDKKSTRSALDNGASRFRLRRIAVRRQEGRRRLRWFTIVGLVVGAGVIILLTVAIRTFFETSPAQFRCWRVIEHSVDRSKHQSRHSDCSPAA